MSGYRERREEAQRTVLCISLRSHEETLNGLFDLPSALRVVMTEHSGYCNKILRKRYESRFNFFLLTGPLKYRKLTEPKQSLSFNCTFLLNTLTEKLCTSSTGSAGIKQQREQQVLFLFFFVFFPECHGNLYSLTVLNNYFTLI